MTRGRASTGCGDLPPLSQGIAVTLSPEQRRARLDELAPGPFPTEESLLAALLADPSESLKCVVAHHVAERHLVALRQDLTRLRPLAGPPLVTYAFDQAIERLDA